MGGKEAQTPASVVDTPSGETSRAPGKSTLTGDPALCDRPGASGVVPWCPLDATTRTNLRMAFHSNVVAAEGRFGIACSELRLEKLLEKPDDLPVFVSMFVDVISGYAIGTIVNAIKNVRNAAGAAGAMIAAVTDKRIESLVKTLADPAKRSAAKPGSIADEQLRYRDYLDHVRDQAARAFQAIRDGGVHDATDAELHALHEGFHPDSHRVSHYRAALEAKVIRYEASGVTRIGTRRGVKDGDPIGAPKRGYFDKPYTDTVARELRVVWLVDGTDRRRLGFEARDRVEDGFGLVKVADPLHYELVPEEFAQEALSTHVAVWMEPPMIVRVPYFPPTTLQLGDVP